jgi:hypothetical protein
VIEELPAWQAFGPNGQAVAAHIDRVAHLTKDEVPVGRRTGRRTGRRMGRRTGRRMGRALP